MSAELCVIFLWETLRPKTLELVCLTWNISEILWVIIDILCQSTNFGFLKHNSIKRYECKGNKNNLLEAAEEPSCYQYSL